MKKLVLLFCILLGFVSCSKNNNLVLVDSITDYSDNIYIHYRIMKREGAGVRFYEVSAVRPHSETSTPDFMVIETKYKTAGNYENADFSNTINHADVKNIKKQYSDIFSITIDNVEYRLNH